MEILDEIYLMVDDLFFDFMLMISYYIGLHDFLPVDEQSWFLEYLYRLKSTSSALFSSDDSLQDVETL